MAMWCHIRRSIDSNVKNTLEENTMLLGKNSDTRFSKSIHCRNHLTILSWNLINRVREVSVPQGVTLTLQKQYHLNLNLILRFMCWMLCFLRMVLFFEFLDTCGRRQAAGACSLELCLVSGPSLSCFLTWNAPLPCALPAVMDSSPWNQELK